ncbi:MAG TPA: DnaB-like helicase C-terminal domain-containing protein [Dermatophilaceae bacterium]|nr:DnaB-like helicase C-terminal domain-containing protein [Dermatophilaceae bacterium]
MTTAPTTPTVPEHLRVSPAGMASGAAAETQRPAPAAESATAVEPGPAVGTGAATDGPSRGQRLRRHSLASLLEETDEAMRSGVPPGARVWATGFDALDRILGGGLRSGELVLLAGAQAKGKTMVGLQLAREAVARGGAAVLFSFEHEAHTLVERLLALEAAVAADATGEERRSELVAGIHDFRLAFESRPEAGSSLRSRLAMLPFGVEALDALTAYGPRLHIHESNAGTTAAQIAAVVAEVARDTGQPPLVLVDYLQKVPTDVAGGEEERVSKVADSLKDFALDAGLPVVAISAADKGILGAGHRMRSHHLRGSSALAYESDIVLVLSDKDDIVSREHLVYDLGNAERFHAWTVLSVEKNRHGLDHVDLEFPKDFAHARLVPTGRRVVERLIEERVFTS